jgi:putative nucleotidyltransferase with HDIG domain
VRIGHLARRFLGALWPGPPRAADVAWVEQVLGADLFALWNRQPNHDRRHSIAVARRVEHALAGSEDADHDRWLAAALVHDIGKVEARLGVYGRVMATVAAAVVGREVAERWSSRRGVARRVGLYLRHPELGAISIRLAGGAPEVAAWAEAHHQAPETWEGLSIPAPVVAALHAADDD